MNDNPKTALKLFAPCLALLGIITVPAHAVDFSLQTKCANAARQLFHDYDPNQNANAYFEAHYSVTLQKCFVRIYNILTDSKDGSSFSEIEIYDALERKKHAEFNGDQSCLKETNSCWMNSGSIWFDANTQRSPPRYSSWLRWSPLRRERERGHRAPVHRCNQQIFYG